MPMQALLDADPDHFRPDGIEKIVAGFELALTALHITDWKDPKALTVDKIVFNPTKQGELDPQRLRDIAVKAFSAR
jgi:hypothetical protein